MTKSERHKDAAKLRRTTQWMDVVLEELQREHARIFRAISALRAARDDARRELEAATPTSEIRPGSA